MSTDDHFAARPKSAATASVGTAETAPLSRRAVLGAVGGAGASTALSAAGLVAGSTSAPAQTRPTRTPTAHGAPGAGSYSQRVYPVMPEGADIGCDPTHVPPPIGARGPQTVRIELETIELEGRLDANSNTRFRYWTFNGTVPGPMMRVRVGDTVEVTLKNREDSALLHNVDFHAATGPGGGAEATTAAPGETKGFRFKALNPGLYIYHCAVPPVVMHVANGMYGLILVEPEGGLPPVDREFYVVQGEIYTEQPFGTAGVLDPSYEKMLNERPEYFVLNGSVGALTTLRPLKAKVGETVRIFFGVGGPNYTSSFHVIGEIFDRVYGFGSPTSEPLRDVATMTVPVGSGAIAELKLEVPGRFVLVDHALSRVERGLAGYLEVEGPANAQIFASTAS